MIESNMNQKFTEAEGGGRKVESNINSIVID
jgi:hypothetical protein